KQKKGVTVSTECIRPYMMMMISALPRGRSVMTPIVIHQCHLNLRSEMRDDDEVVSRCLPQQATVCATLAQGVYHRYWIHRLYIIDQSLVHVLNWLNNCRHCQQAARYVSSTAATHRQVILLHKLAI